MFIVCMCVFSLVQLLQGIYVCVLMLLWDLLVLLWDLLVLLWDILVLLWDILVLLLQVNMPVDSFESPLTLAACGGHYELAALLLSKGADLEEVNDEGLAPVCGVSHV